MIECTMKLSELVQPEKNVRIHTEQQLKEFERSVRMFGQIRPLVVDENNLILAGNGLYETMIRMRIEEARVYKFEELSENQKKKLMIADNRVYALGVDDLTSMNDILSELIGDLDVPGFDEDMLRQMMADEDEITEVIAEYGKLDEDEVSKVHEQAERKEAAMQKNTEGQELSNGIQDTESFSTGDSTAVHGTEMQDSEGRDVKKCVTCPKCGERIWL